MRISDWSSDVCSSDLNFITLAGEKKCMPTKRPGFSSTVAMASTSSADVLVARTVSARQTASSSRKSRSEEHTSELQSLMRISYAVFCLKKKNKQTHTNIYTHYNTTRKLTTRSRSHLNH